MAPAFRMHVRAHGTVAKFFRALHDATKDQVMYTQLLIYCDWVNHVQLNCDTKHTQKFSALGSAAMSHIAVTCVPRP